MAPLVAGYPQPDGVLDVIEEGVGALARLELVRVTVRPFLPGQGEIRQVASRIEGRLGPLTDIQPLYGGLSSQEQDAAIKPAPAASMVLAIDSWCGSGRGWYSKPQ